MPTPAFQDVNCAQSDWRRSQTLTHADVRDQVLDGRLLEELGEQAGPVGVNGHIGGLDQGRDVVSLRRQKQSQVRQQRADTAMRLQPGLQARGIANQSTRCCTMATVMLVCHKHKLLGWELVRRQLSPLCCCCACR